MTQPAFQDEPRESEYIEPANDAPVENVEQELEAAPRGEEMAIEETPVCLADDELIIPKVAPSSTPSPPRCADELPRDVRRIIALSVLFCGMLALGVHVLLGWAHHADDYHLDSASQVWIDLSVQADQGVLYPSTFIEASERGETGVIMPIGLLLNTAASRVTGDPLSSAKLVSGGCMLLLLGVMGLVMRRLRCSTLAFFGVLGAALLTEPLLQTTTSIPAMALPASLQLLAILLFLDRQGHSETPDRRTVFMAALACALAMFCRLDAVWGMIAIVLWLATRHPRRIWTFAGYQVGWLLVIAAFFHLLSDGRFVDHLRASFDSSDGLVIALWSGLLQLLANLRDQAPATWVLIPLAILGLILHAIRGRRDIIHYGLVCAILIAILGHAFGAPRSTFLLDVIVLSAIGAADLWRTTMGERRTLGTLQAAMAILLIWSCLGGLFMNVRGDALDALNTIVFGDPPLPVQVVDDDELVAR